MTDASLGLDPKDVTALVSLVRRFIPDGELWAFGSRVSGRARPFSDLDLAIIREGPLDATTKAELRYALSESDFPVKVDLLEWARADASFREIIQGNHIVIAA